MVTTNLTKNDQESGKWVPITEQTVTSSTTLFFPCDPNMLLNISVKKGANTIIVAVTNTAKKDIETGTYIDRSTDAVDYFAGDSTGITGVKVDTTAYSSGNVEITIMQYKFMN